MKRLKMSNTNILINDCLKLDIGSAAEGYIFAAILEDNPKKKKLKVEKNNKILYYNLKELNTYETIPLQLGSGIYTVSLMQNICAKKYENLGSLTFQVTLSQENICFFYPNQYVNYTPDSSIIAFTNNLCQDARGKQVYDLIKNYITKNYRYDYLQAARIKPGVLPDINRCLNKKMGICQDLAALTVCMLRSQEIAARLVIGYADKIYHAWVRVDVDGKKYLFDPTAAVTKTKTATKYVVEREY